MKIAAVIAVAVALAVATQHATLKPVVTPLFAEGGRPTFLVHVTNDARDVVRPGSDRYRCRARVDGKEIEPGDVVGASDDVYQDSSWQAVVRLRATTDQRGKNPFPRTEVQEFTEIGVSLSSGRHLIAFRCGGAWSDDVAFYWKTAEPTAISDPEEYVVFRSLLPSSWPVRVAKARELVFRADTFVSWSCMPKGGALETDWRPVVESFRAANSFPRLLQPGFDLGMPYRVVSARDIQRAFEEVRDDPAFGFTGFNRRYPKAGGSVLQVSAVGFDAERRRAMVYRGHHCGSLCAESMVHLLEKVDNIWREAKVPGVSQCQSMS